MSQPCSIGRHDHQRQAGIVRDLGDGRNVEHFEAGIAEDLGEDEARLRADGAGEGGGGARVDEAGGDAEARQSQLQHVDGAAIERGGGDDVAALPHQRDDGEVERRLAARRADRADAAFERGDALLQHGDGRVADARIDEAGLLEVEQRGGVVAVLEDEARRLIDRHRARPGGRVGPLPGMEGEGGEIEIFGVGHGGHSVGAGRVTIRSGLAGGERFSRTFEPRRTRRPPRKMIARSAKKTPSCPSCPSW